jgi:hypothetical protein
MDVERSGALDFRGPFSGILRRGAIDIFIYGTGQNVR